MTKTWIVQVFVGPRSDLQTKSTRAQVGPGSDENLDSPGFLPPNLPAPPLPNPWQAYLKQRPVAEAGLVAALEAF